MILDILKKVDKKSYIPIPVFMEVDEIYRTGEINKQNLADKRVEIEIINAPIINIEGVEWQQIIEAKSDDDFRNKVRNFSIFINENFEGKSLSFITDSLEKKIEDYKTTLSKHGFKIGMGSLKEILNSKSVWGTIALIMLNSIISSPHFILMTGTVGAILELSQVQIKISEQRHELHDFQKNADIALLIELEKMNNLNLI